MPNQIEAFKVKMKTEKKKQKTKQERQKLVDTKIGCVFTLTRLLFTMPTVFGDDSERFLFFSLVSWLWMTRIWQMRSTERNGDVSDVLPQPPFSLHNRKKKGRGGGFIFFFGHRVKHTFFYVCVCVCCFPFNKKESDEIRQLIKYLNTQCVCVCVPHISWQTWPLDSKKNLNRRGTKRIKAAPDHNKRPTCLF